METTVASVTASRDAEFARVREAKARLQAAILEAKAQAAADVLYGPSSWPHLKPALQEALRETVRTIERIAA